MSLKSKLGLSRFITDRIEAIRLIEKLEVNYPDSANLAKIRRGDSFKLEVARWNWQRWRSTLTIPAEVTPNSHQNQMRRGLDAIKKRWRSWTSCSFTQPV